MTGKELVKQLQKNGWVIDRVHGSHHIMKKGDKTETVPVHSNKELPKGLLNSIKKRTGI
ncbi:MAG: type II toxin-antitoxin system HicA family toxin [Lachnospiraceae bacterium]|nr:type II toxin-antitoxin system HicA family toxin [Lachnospiraceae bacterium]